MLRTHTCGQLSEKDKDKQIQLTGWVHRRRDHGGVIFIDLRDRYGVTQIKFDPDVDKNAHQKAEALRGEWVIKIIGKVVLRPDGMANNKLQTGKIEIQVSGLEILSKADTLPFEIDEEKKTEVKEEKRMKYRYLDIRKPEVADVLIKRNYFINFIRQYLTNLNFVEVETPILSKSTPEGARDFLVPSRLQKGDFYALPQSPQQYKQLLMIGGMDRYFQVSKCFRDEDTRGDRQAEFSQLDMEMSFIDREDILNITEDLFSKAIKEVFPHKKIMNTPWPRMDYDEVMLKYGTDKPDLRFGLEIKDLTNMVKDCGFKVFTDAVAEGGVVRAICATGASKFSRGEIDELTEYVKKFGAKGLAYIIVLENGLSSPITKFLGDKLAKDIVKETNAAAGDIIFFGADKESIVQESLANLRNKLGEKLGLIAKDTLAMAFVVDFPLFSPDPENGHYAPYHHMFTTPKEEDLELLDKDPIKVKSYQYDMVANGVELGGGSLRIHRKDIQEKIFELIGFDKKKKSQFSQFLKAFQYGVPPHGGIAPGLDRILMVLMNKESIRDVMAFPKTGDGRDLMMKAPSEVEEKQLKELGIKINKQD